MKISTISLLIAAALAAFAIAAAGCAGSSEPASPEPAAQAAQTTPERAAPTAQTAPERASVKLALDWFPNANHTGLFIAQNKGYFDDEGLDVEMYTPSDPSTVLQTVGAGSDHFGMSYQPDVLLARNEGVPVVSVLGVVQHPLNSVMTLKTSGLERPADLAGKKVGYPGIPTNEPLLDTMLKSDGLNGLEDVEMVNIGWNISESLIAEKVDAVVGAYWTYESIHMGNLGHPVNVMRMEEWGVPDYYELVLVTSEDYLAENEGVVERFVRAMKRGYNEAIGDPQAGVDALVAEKGDEIDQDIDRPGADLLEALWQLPDGGGFGTQTPERWDSFVGWMKENDMIDDSLVSSAAYRVIE